MKHFSYEGGYLILRLTPAQCAMIARACRFAGEAAFTDEVEVWRTWAILFQASASTGLAARWHMQPADEQALDEALQMNNL